MWEIQSGFFRACITTTCNAPMNGWCGHSPARLACNGWTLDWALPSTCTRGGQSVVTIATPALPVRPVVPAGSTWFLDHPHSDRQDQAGHIHQHSHLRTHNRRHLQMHLWRRRTSTCEVFLVKQTTVEHISQLCCQYCTIFHMCLCVVGVIHCMWMYVCTYLPVVCFTFAHYKRLEIINY